MRRSATWGRRKMGSWPIFFSFFLFFASLPLSSSRWNLKPGPFQPSLSPGLSVPPASNTALHHPAPFGFFRTKSLLTHWQENIIRFYEPPIQLSFFFFCSFFFFSFFVFLACQLHVDSKLSEKEPEDHQHLKQIINLSESKHFSCCNQAGMRVVLIVHWSQNSWMITGILSFVSVASLPLHLQYCLWDAKTHWSTLACFGIFFLSIKELRCFAGRRDYGKIFAEHESRFGFVRIIFALFSICKSRAGVAGWRGGGGELLPGCFWPVFRAW